jgi:hypothetical protein
MKPAAAFAAGLWTGAVVMAAVGVFYLRAWEPGRAHVSPPGRDTLEGRLQLLQQEQSRAEAEQSRLKQTIAELQAQLEARATAEARRQRRLAYREQAASEAPTERWIVDAVANADPRALPRLERAATENNAAALDALALLAELDNGEALNRVWASPDLSAEGRERATFLLAATIEANPQGEQLLHAVFAATPPDPRLCAAALAGIESPNFKTRLHPSTDLALPQFVPDYTQRVWMVESWRTIVTDPKVATEIDRVHNRLARLVSAEPKTP